MCRCMILLLLQKHNARYRLRRATWSADVTVRFGYGASELRSRSRDYAHDLTTLKLRLRGALISIRCWGAGFLTPGVAKPAKTPPSARRPVAPPANHRVRGVLSV